MIAPERTRSLEVAMCNFNCHEALANQRKLCLGRGVNALGYLQELSTLRISLRSAAHPLKIHAQAAHQTPPVSALPSACAFT